MIVEIVLYLTCVTQWIGLIFLLTRFKRLEKSHWSLQDHFIEFLRREGKHLDYTKDLYSKINETKVMKNWPVA